MTFILQASNSKPSWQQVERQGPTHVLHPQGERGKQQIILQGSQLNQVPSYGTDKEESDTKEKGIPAQKPLKA